MIGYSSTRIIKKKHLPFSIKWKSNVYKGIYRWKSTFIRKTHKFSVLFLFSCYLPKSIPLFCITTMEQNTRQHSSITKGEKMKESLMIIRKMRIKLLRCWKLFVLCVLCGFFWQPERSTASTGYEMDGWMMIRIKTMK